MPTQESCELDPALLLGFSIQLGIDLTPEGDVDERLTAIVEYASSMEADLATIERRIRAYEETVQGHELVELDGLETIAGQITRQAVVDAVQAVACPVVGGSQKQLNLEEARKLMGYPGINKSAFYHALMKERYGPS